MTDGGTSARASSRLSANLLWSLLGAGLPIVAAVAAVPVLLEQLGIARFGVLSIAWTIVGYFSLFDLGLGRAVTQLVARHLARDEPDAIAPLFWTSMALTAALGVVGGAVLYAITPWLVRDVFELPADLHEETALAFYLLSASLPFMIVTSALRGLLEAYQRFDLVNLVRAPTSALNYLGPLAVLPFSRSLFGVVVVLLATRVAAFAIHAGMCLRVFPQLRQHCAVDPLSGRALLSFGGWLTLSNLAAPLLLYLGRFVLAATVSIEAVAYFSTPYDVMINLLLIPGVFSSVLFPVYTQTAQVRPQDAHRLYRKSVLQLFAIMLPICGLAVVLAESVLAWWIDPEFAAKSHRVAELIAIGVLINSVGHLSQGMVQACGRPDLTAKLHVCELILYVPYLYWLVAKFSIEGAGMAWVVRVTISTVVLHVLARTCIGRLRNTALAGAGA